MYVLFEGIDTVGKSTQIAQIAKRRPDAILTHEPGGTPFGQRAREILLEGNLHSARAEMLLFLADRAEHYDEVIAPNRDKLIISDRGFLSGIGYALAGGEADFETLLSLNRFALDGHFPDRIILFVTDIDTLQERTGQKRLDGIEQRGLEYLMSVQVHMRQSLEKLSIDHLIVDATESIKAIQQNIVSYLQI
jgi:dTMP kinase